jgi:hypothetical protein
MKTKLFGLSLGSLVLVSIVIISTAMHFGHFQKDLMSMHVWRQCETQSTIINFYEEDMNIFNPRRNDRGNGEGYHRMEFPLMQWLVAGAYKIFGNHLVISRIFMFIIGLFSVFGMYKLLKTLFDYEFLAVAGAWAFNFSPSFYYYTINPIPDNFALCFAIWGIAVFFSWIKKGRSYFLPLSGILLSIAALSKLPFILYFVVPLSYFLILIKEKKSWKVSLIKGSELLIFMVLPLAWYVSVVPQWHGNGIVRGIFENKVPATGLLGNFRHHLTITLPDLLLNYGSVLFFLCGFYFIRKNKAFKNRLFPLFAALGVVLIFYVLFELNMIGKSHDYYFFPFLPLLFILVAYGAYNLFILKSMAIRYFVIILLLVLPLLAYLRMAIRWDPSSPGFNKDLLVYKNELREAVPKNALCIAGNDISHYIFFYYIDKKGWGFDDNNLSGEKLAKMIEEGARYLYSDSRQTDDNQQITPFLDKLIMEKGSVRVYSLKQGLQP